MVLQVYVFLHASWYHYHLIVLCILHILNYCVLLYLIGISTSVEGGWLREQLKESRFGPERRLERCVFAERKVKGVDENMESALLLVLCGTVGCDHLERMECYHQSMMWTVTTI